MKNNQEETVKLLQCPTKNEIPELLKKYHDVSGHDGINTTYKIISREYYWKGMSQDVKDYVSVVCMICMITSFMTLARLVFCANILRYTITIEKNAINLLNNVLITERCLELQLFPDKQS